ncbi:Uncharacterized OsmC-related protein [Polynucleobacter meluiroseus]|jgi:putative redox protein|uniref:Uncharacterized OsmC-related protein n=1 Tax=Polynucleobacter meluiroseus TaxID=1938814 RepID=A0A240DXH6_9BURK|nr:OsmC family protein [Polynucleobacter meluiroseus]SNX27899.1 Uncharacterized OsmC-related protein [Polynucleobacter meluiroseus]
MRTVQSQFGEGALQQKISVGDLSLLADTEITRGGADSGPSPHEYLAAALASCTSMTLKMYAQHKGWNLRNALVSVLVTRDNDVESFSRDIQLQGELDVEQQTRLLEIANKCPIHKALTGQIQIKTQLIS